MEFNYSFGIAKLLHFFLISKLMHNMFSYKYDNFDIFFIIIVKNEFTHVILLYLAL